MTRSELPDKGSGLRVTVGELTSTGYDTASALAQAFGATILVPSWWPADAQEIAYSLDGSPDRPHYRVAQSAQKGNPSALSATWKLRGRDDHREIG